MALRTDATRDLHLFRGQVAPRWREILLSWVTFGAIGAGVASALVAPLLPVADLKISAIVSAGFTFASISMGACISGLVLSLALPGAERLRNWARLKGTTPGKSALSDLIFTLAWAGLAQVALVITCVLATLLGGDLQVSPSNAWLSHRIGLAAGLLVFFYAVFELVVVIQTIMQIGVIVIIEERSKPSGSSRKSRACRR